MNWVDSAVLLVVVISALVAFARGFVAEALGIGAWIGAYFVASNTGYLLRPYMRSWLGNADVADPASYAAVFLVGLIILSIFTGMIGGAVRASMLGGLDRTLGMLFGIARGVMIVAAIYIGGTMMMPTERWPEAVGQARSLGFVYSVAKWMSQFLPPEYRPHVPSPPEAQAASAADLLQPTPQGRATARR